MEKEFLETIYFKDGEMPLLSGHQKRFEATQKEAWGKIIFPTLKTLIETQSKPPTKQHQTYKCRIRYNSKDVHIEFIPYDIHPVSSLRLMTDNDLDYHLKYADRHQLVDLKQKAGNDIIIVKNGLITDTTYTNVAFWDGKNWLTPATALLSGVRRANLLEQGIIKISKIRVKDLGQFQKIRLINAMMSWEDSPTLPMDAIIQ